MFEAAGRLGSFTAAARELGMTQPAVTQQIRGLEHALGQALFDRAPNRVDLNRRGALLLATVTEAFDTLADGIMRIQTDRRSFMLAVNPGIAQRWLVPYLADLQAELGETDLRLWLFDRDGELSNNHFDAAVHLSSGTLRGMKSIDLFQEVTSPIASPELAARLGLTSKSEPTELPEAQLLHLDGQDRSWMDWHHWFIGTGCKPPSLVGATVLYNNNALLTQDVIAGRGIALGWKYLTDELLDQGLVVQVGPEVTRPGSHYRILWPSSTSDESIEALSAFFKEALPQL